MAKKMRLIRSVYDGRRIKVTSHNFISITASVLSFGMFYRA